MWLLSNFMYRFILASAVFCGATFIMKVVSIATDLPSVFGLIVGLVMAIVLVLLLIRESFLDYKEYAEENKDEDEDKDAVAFPAMPVIPQEIPPVNTSQGQSVSTAPAIQQASAEEQEMLRREQEQEAQATAAEDSRQASISADEAALAAIESATADSPIEEPPPYEEEDYYYPPAEDYAEIFGNNGEN